MGLCLLCTSANHRTEDCYGKGNKLPRRCAHCKSRGHVTPLCNETDKGGNSPTASTHVCANTSMQEQPYILPIVAITVFKGKRKYRFNCLFDTGSQRTYFSRNVIERLGCYKSLLTPVEYEVKTFLGSQTKKLNQLVVGIEVTKGSSLSLPVLIDDEFDMNLRFDNFKSVKKNLINLNYTLAFLHKKNDIRVHGLLGIDVIQFMKNIKMIDCMQGSAWEFPAGISPFGNCQHFLYDKQCNSKKIKNKDLHNYHAIVSKYSTCSDIRVNFVMNPIKSYPDPLAEIFDESQVERNLEKMFDVDSLGISSEDEATCNYDKSKIMEFENSIEFKNNAYHVKLPWHDDKIKSVPSNHRIALSVLNGVVDAANSKSSNDVPNTNSSSVPMKQRPKRTKNLKGCKNSLTNPYIYY